MTEFDSLGEIWRGRAGAPSHSPSEEIERVRARAAQLEKVVRQRDRIETIVALALFPIFAFVAVATPYPLSALGAAIVALACIAIPIRLRRARRAASDPAQPLATALRADLDRLRAQERLLGTVLWWYLTPLGVGVTLFVAGGPSGPVFKVAYAVIVAIAYGWLLHLNARAVRRDLQPLTHQLEAWLADLGEASE